MPLLKMLPCVLNRQRHIKMCVTGGWSAAASECKGSYSRDINIAVVGMHPTITLNGPDFTCLPPDEAIDPFQGASGAGPWAEQGAGTDNCRSVSEAATPVEHEPAACRTHQAVQNSHAASSSPPLQQFQGSRASQDTRHEVPSPPASDLLLFRRCADQRVEDVAASARCGELASLRTMRMHPKPHAVPATPLATPQLGALLQEHSSSVVDAALPPLSAVTEAFKASSGHVNNGHATVDLLGPTSPTTAPSIRSAASADSSFDAHQRLQPRSPGTKESQQQGQTYSLPPSLQEGPEGCLPTQWSSLYPPCRSKAPVLDERSLFGTGSAGSLGPGGPASAAASLGKDLAAPHSAGVTFTAPDRGARPEWEGMAPHVGSAASAAWNGSGTEITKAPFHGQQVLTMEGMHVSAKAATAAARAAQYVVQSGAAMGDRGSPEIELVELAAHGPTRKMTVHASADSCPLQQEQPTISMTWSRLSSLKQGGGSGVAQEQAALPVGRKQQESLHGGNDVSCGTWASGGLKLGSGRTKHRVYDLAIDVKSIGAKSCFGLTKMLHIKNKFVLENQTGKELEVRPLNSCREPRLDTWSCASFQLAWASALAECMCMWFLGRNYSHSLLRSELACLGAIGGDSG
jgi:hypothetical protein